MTSWKTPTPEEVSRTVALLSRAANYRHFFGKLDNPLWVRPLGEEGFFRNPPKVLYEDSGRSKRFPRWPESKYLARMAPHAPADVAEVLGTILETDNIDVREDILRAALAMPVEFAVRFADAATKWATEDSLDDHLALKIGKLVSLLAVGGKTGEALALAAELLKVEPSDKRKKALGEPLTVELRPDPVARFGTWYFEQILENNIPQLVVRAGLDAIAILCDLLEGALRIVESPNAQEIRLDISCIWRPAIEGHEQNLGDTVLDALISSLRDSVERICIKDPESIVTAVELLDKREWPVFKRISLHLLSRFAHVVPVLVETRIADEGLFDNHYVLHEYHNLCRVGFALMSPKARRTVLGWIDAGLEREEVEKWIKSDGKEPTDQLVDEIIDGWRLDRLSPIKEQLTGEWAERYACLVNKLGEPRHPDFGSWHESRTGPNSPLTPQQLSSMPMTRILAFMRTWEPSAQSLLAPSVEGMGHSLTVLVTAHPKGFAAMAREFIGLEPTYVRSLLSGLENATRRGMEFDWKQVLALCEWVILQPISISGRSDRYAEKDPDWQLTRGQIADLLSAGFGSVQNSVLIEERNAVWQILQPLTDDPYPSAHTGSARNDAWDQPSTDSWNTTRGKALRAAIRYGLWVSENADKKRLPEDRRDRSFSIIPELKAILEAHLDTHLDPSPATRSVYGQWLPSLVWLDREWLSNQLEIIFPSHESQRWLWKAAWDGYITLCRVERPVFEMLRNQYKRAIAFMEMDTEDHFRSDPDSSLVEHLMTVYWRGGELLEAQDSLIREFFEKGPAKLREHAMHLIGRSLHKEPVELPEDIARRVTSLWEWRRDVMQKSNDSNTYGGEAVKFGLWFVSGKLDERWALEQLLFAIEFSGGVVLDHLVVERLAALAGQFPLAVAECLDSGLRGVTEVWRVYGWHEPAFDALRAVIESGDSVAVKKAMKVANGFGELGFRNFRALVPSLGKNG